MVQCILEGQINEPTQDDIHSTESGETETSVLAEGILEELGQEWRVLHPFEIPGVRFPTDATPPNQRRLAENDVLVELIQTTEYLEDAPTWGQGDYRIYPLDMVIPFIKDEEEVEVEEDENGLTKDPQRDQMEDWKEDSPVEMGEIRGEISQMHNVRNQQDRQEEEWSVPTSIERREDNTVRQESQRAPPTSPHLEDRLFTDWSSLDSP